MIPISLGRIPHTTSSSIWRKYGSDVIDKTLYYLGSGMISNHRCDTLEECAVLRGVYDVSGLDMDSKEKRNTPDIDMLIKEWEDSVVSTTPLQCRFRIRNGSLFFGVIHTI